MLKKHLSLISFWLVALFFCANLQASQDEFDDYTSDFLDVDCLSKALSNIDNTMADANDYEEANYNDMKCDKREDRDFAKKRHISELQRIKKLKELNLIIMKRLQLDALTLTISLPSSPEDEERQANWSSKAHCHDHSFKDSEGGIEFSPMVQKVYSIENLDEENLDELSTHSSVSTLFAQIEKQSPEKLELQYIKDYSDHVEL